MPCRNGFRALVPAVTGVTPDRFVASPALTPSVRGPLRRAPSTRQSRQCRQEIPTEVCGNGVVGGPSSATTATPPAATAAAPTAMLERLRRRHPRPRRAVRRRQHHQTATAAAPTACSRPSCGDGVLDRGRGSATTATPPAATAAAPTARSTKCGDGILDHRRAVRRRQHHRAATAAAPTASSSKCGDGVLDRRRGVRRRQHHRRRRLRAPTCIVDKCGDGVLNRQARSATTATAHERRRLQRRLPDREDSRRRLHARPGRTTRASGSATAERTRSTRSSPRPACLPDSCRMAIPCSPASATKGKRARSEARPHPASRSNRGPAQRGASRRRLFGRWGDRLGQRRARHRRQGHDDRPRWRARRREQRSGRLSHERRQHEPLIRPPRTEGGGSTPLSIRRPQASQYSKADGPWIRVARSGELPCESCRPC